MSIQIKTIEDINKITSSLYKNTDEQIKNLIERYKLEIACHKGCSTCCSSLRVEILPPEAFFIGTHIKQIFTSEKISQLIAKLMLNDQRLRGKTLLESSNENRQCAFLDNGECSIYQYRPYKCRAFLASNSVQCLIDQCNSNQLPIIDNFLNAHGNLKKYIKTIQESKLDLSPAEMNNALSKILDSTTLESQYLSGEKKLFNELKYL